MKYLSNMIGTRETDRRQSLLDPPHSLDYYLTCFDDIILEQKNFSPDLSLLDSSYQLLDYNVNIYNVSINKVEYNNIFGYTLKHFSDSFKSNKIYQDEFGYRIKELNEKTNYNGGILFNDLKNCLKEYGINEIPELYTNQFGIDSELNIESLFDLKFNELDDKEYEEYISFNFHFINFKEQIRNYLVNKLRERYAIVVNCILRQKKLNINFLNIPLLYCLMEYLDHIENIKKTLLEKLILRLTFSINNIFNYEFKAKNRYSLFLSCS